MSSNTPANNSRRYKQRRSKIGTCAQVILRLLAVSGVMSVAVLAPGAVVALRPFVYGKKYSSKQLVQRNLESLHKHGLIEYRTDRTGRQQVALTSYGQWEAHIRRLTETQSSTTARWDGIWRVVVFDIPENKRYLRAEIHRALKLYGFLPLQKSVWVYPHPCEAFVRLVKQHLGVSRDVLCLHASYVENDHQLKREFSLH